MNRKFLCLYMTILISATITEASEKIHVAALDSFKTEEPTECIKVLVLKDSIIGGYSLKEADVLHCNIIEVKSPKRGKRAATFSVSPDYYISEGQEHSIEGTLKGKYSKFVLSKDELKNIDVEQVAKKAAIKVGGHFVKGLAPAASLAEGMIKNEDGNRLKSGVSQLYKDSPFSYFSKGPELCIEPGDRFNLVFKTPKNKKVKFFKNDDKEALSED